MERKKYIFEIVTLVLFIHYAKGTIYESSVCGKTSQDVFSRFQYPNLNGSVVQFKNYNNRINVVVNVASF